MSRLLCVLIVVLFLPSPLAAQRIGVLGPGMPAGLAVGSIDTDNPPEDVTPPVAPSNPFPADAANNVNVTPTLTFQTSGAITFAVYFGTDATPVNKYVTSGPSFTPGTLALETIYYWQAEACNVTPQGGSTIQCTLGPIWSFSTVSPGAPPTSILAISPSNGATGAALTPTLVCSANNTTLYELQVGIANPPTGGYLSSSSTCSFTPATYTNSQTVYWQIRATGSGGTLESSVFSFTTIAVPPPTPDPDCVSTTASPTGANHLLYTPCRVDTWLQMKSDYEDNTTAPATIGGRLYKWNKYQADRTQASSSLSQTADIGQWAAWMVAVNGCAAVQSGTGTGLTARYADAAYARTDSYLTARERDGYYASPYNFARNADNGNATRTYTMRVIEVSDIIRPCITGVQYDRLKVGVAEQIQGGLLQGATHQMNLADSDQTIGYYFHARVHCLVEPTYQLAIDNCANINPVNPALGGRVGGLDSVQDYSAYLLGPSSQRTARDAIRMYVEFLSEDGAWMEGNHYDLETVVLMLEGYDIIKRMTGEDHFPEITAWMQNHARFLREQLTPDLSRFIGHGELTEPRSPARGKYFGTVAEMAGLTSGTEGDKLQDLIVEWEAIYGFATSGTASLSPGAMAPNPLFFYDPYRAQTEWRGDTTYTDRYVRLGNRKSHGTDPQACQFHADFFGPQRWFEARNYPVTVHHAENMPGVESWDLYCNGEYKITDVKYIPIRSGADGANTTIIHGRSKHGIPVFNDPYHYTTFAATDHANYYAVTHTTGGAKSGVIGSVVSCPNNTSGGFPDVFLHENTRRMVYLPSRDDTQVIVTHDRVSALVTVPDLTCYSTAENSRITTYDALSSGGTVFLVNHALTLPTLASDTYTWTSANGSSTIKMTLAFPAAFDSTIVNETTDINYGTLWAAAPAVEKKWHIRNGLTGADQQWNTFLTVHQVYNTTGGAAGTITAISDAGKAEGVHITRANDTDAVVVFNSTQGADLTPTTGPDDSHNEQLDVVRFRSTGFTVSWTSVASTTYVILNDLNPANTWTYTINGGGSQSISEDAAGNAYIELSGSGAKTLVVTGS